MSSQKLRKSRKVSRKSRKVLQKSRKVLQKSRKVSQKSRKVSQKSRKVSRKSRKVSRKSRKVSQKSRKVSRKSRKVSRKSRRSRKTPRKVSRKVSRKSKKVSQKSRKAPRKSRKSRKVSQKRSNEKEFILKVYVVYDKGDDTNNVSNVSKIPSNVKSVFNKYFKEKMASDINIVNDTKDSMIKINNISYGNDKFIKISATSKYPLDYVDKSKGINYSLRSNIEVYSDKSIWQSINRVKGSDGMLYNFDILKL